MKVAVTGASGFVGGRVARALSAEGHEVISLGRRSAGTLAHPLPNYRVWDIEEDMPRENVDAVVHSAALVGDWGPDAEYARANVAGTERVLRAFSGAGHFVHISTSSVYSDNQPKRALREDAATGDCITAYGRTKAAAERLVMRARSDAVILRPHIVYGPGDSTLLPRLARAVRFGRLPVPGTGRNHVSVTHVDNLVHAVTRALGSDANGTFNVADAEPVCIGELLETVFLRARIRAAPVYIPRALAWSLATALEMSWPSYHAPRGPVLTHWLVAHMADEHTLDITRARECLGYAPRWTFANGPLGL